MPTYQLSALAAEDLDEILQYTFERFGKKQMLKYNTQLSVCLDKISQDEGLYKKIEIEEKIVRSLRCQKHYIFALERGDKPLLILAILHEKMELTRRLKNRL